MKFKPYLILSFLLALFSCAGQKTAVDDSEKAEFLYNQTIVYYLKGDLTSSEKGFNEIVKKYPFYTPAYIMLGKTYFFMNNFKDSEKSLQQSLKITPNVVSFIWLSKIAMINTNMPQSLDYLNKALNLDFSNPLTHYELGKYYRKTGQYEKAVYNLNYAISYEDMYLEMKNELASLYSELGVKELAVKLYEDILKNGRVSDEMRTNIQSILNNMRKTK